MLRNDGCLYVDKTRFIEQILNGDSNFYFLGRPRRFGKSLFLSTLKCFFEGKRELFKGLYADTMDWNWAPYPVLYIDLNTGSHEKEDDLEILLDSLLKKWESKYDVSEIAGNISVRFRNVIEKASEKTGLPVAILVDEYDKPLVHNLDNPELFEKFRTKLADFYSNFKTCADYIRLVFITGVSRFAHLTIFSGLNNLSDITFDNSFGDICGITQDELDRYFRQGTQKLAEEYEMSYEEMAAKVKSWYDGYRFAPKGKDIYNPFSLLRLMSTSQFMNYWIQTGHATLLTKQLKRFDIDLNALLDSKCSINDLTGMDLDDPKPLALFYQTGYLTIKKYNREFNSVLLGLPNKEVTNGFLSFIMPLYVKLHSDKPDIFIENIIEDLRGGRAEAFIKKLQSFFASVSYELHVDNENNFHNALVVLMKLIGVYVREELRTSDGRIDMLLETSDYIYIVEIKRNKSAREALNQINEKDYSLPFECSGKKIFKIGVNFSTEKRTIDDWIIA